ncbi:hypothetical protein ACHWQZ_G004869 [Mnemiopsis leidyi]
MRTVVVLTLLLGVVYSYCPSHVESRLDQVITKLEMMINSLENEDFIFLSMPDGTEEPPTPDTSEGDSRTNFLFCVPIRLQNSCPAGYVARSGSRDSNGRRSFMCCK